MSAGLRHMRGSGRSRIGKQAESVRKESGKSLSFILIFVDMRRVMREETREKAADALRAEIYIFQEESMLGKVAVIGGGKMGEVIAAGIISNHLALPSEVTVTDVIKERREYLKMEYGVEVSEDNAAAAKKAAVVILAVKPQAMRAVLQGMAAGLDETKLVISIAAGVPVKSIETWIGGKPRVIRAMPNTAALVGEGAAALAKGGNASDIDLELAKAVFDSVGKAAVVEEYLMDAVTGLSGSGPGYVFVIIDALSDAGVHVGLSRDVARKLAAQTLLGAAKLCLNGDKHPGELRDMVTSPAGTTIAGIKALEEGGIRATLIKAVEAATLRSKVLGKSEE